MRYFYTSSIGLIEVKESDNNYNLAHETKDLAQLQYYRSELTKVKDNIRKTEKSLEIHKKYYENLENEFKHLKDIFPEEFL